MKWTRIRPTEPGRYWWMPDGFVPQVVTLAKCDGSGRLRCLVPGLDLGSDLFEYRPALWAGPLIAPEQMEFLHASQPRARSA